jgi:hypothetical protein
MEEVNPANTLEESFEESYQRLRRLGKFQWLDFRASAFASFLQN